MKMSGRPKGQASFRITFEGTPFQAFQFWKKAVVLMDDIQFEEWSIADSREFAKLVAAYMGGTVEEIPRDLY